jgi:hypothetical protein
MTNWRRSILRKFTPQISRLTLVADPDGLMTEEGVLQGIRERGFELIPFDDAVSFRYAYESKYRSLWDQGKSTELVVALRTAAADLKFLPFDLLKTGRQLRFTLGELFPNLAYPIVEALHRADLDRLYAAQEQFPAEPLGENATKDFILRHVFGFTPEVVTSPASLLHCLLAKHYRNQRMPDIFERRLVALLRQRPAFQDWPLEQIVADRPAFLEFLQERWPYFLRRLASGKAAGLKDKPPAAPKRFPGPEDLPFDDHDVKAYLDNFFAEGLLRPVDLDEAGTLLSEWVAVGLKIDPERDAVRRLETLAKLIEQTIPSPQDRHQQWLDFAFRWAELDVAWFRVPAKARAPFATLRDALDTRVNDRFQQWLANLFHTLHNQSPVPPVMVHHIPRFLARQMERDSCKVALVVLDGLAISQWITLQECLASHQPRFAFNRQGVFAWVPTLTPISRQSIFAGKPPLLFVGA